MIGEWQRGQVYKCIPVLRNDLRYGDPLYFAEIESEDEERTDGDDDGAENVRFDPNFVEKFRVAIDRTVALGMTTAKHELADFDVRKIINSGT